MRKILIACETIRKEVELAMKITEKDYPIVWIESGLHEHPEQLQEELQNQLNKLSGLDQVLLAFGFCGNAVLGLKTGDFQLIIPRAEDCISLLLGSNEKRRETIDLSHTYFLTEGWLDNEENIWKEYQYVVDKYGKAKADRIFTIMLKNYSYLAAIDTGAYDFESFYQKILDVAETLNLDPVKIKGTLTYLEKLLTGPYNDEDFLILQPGEEATYENLRQIEPLKSSGQVN